MMMVQQENGRDSDGNSDEPFDGVEDAENTEIEAVEEPSLVEDDEPLPWLESDYDEEDEGPDTARLVGFGLLGFIALALLLAAAWYFLRDRPDPDLMPEGSTIESPDGAMKERPEDAGGKEFEGTGNVAPTVGEGQTTEGRLGNGDDAPRPSIDAATSSSQAGSSQTGSSNSSGSTASSGSGVGVQVGAFSSKAGANTAWSTLSGQTTSLKGFKHRVVEGKVDGGTVFRLQAVAGDSSAANKLCAALKSEGIACQVKN